MLGNGADATGADDGRRFARPFVRAADRAARVFGLWMKHSASPFSEAILQGPRGVMIEHAIDYDITNSIEAPAEGEQAMGAISGGFGPETGSRPPLRAKSSRRHDRGSKPAAGGGVSLDAGGGRDASRAGPAAAPLVGVERCRRVRTTDPANAPPARSQRARRDRRDGAGQHRPRAAVAGPHLVPYGDESRAFRATAAIGSAMNAPRATGDEPSLTLKIRV
jgi:hypothetical protein